MQHPQIWYDPACKINFHSNEDTPLLAAGYLHFFLDKFFFCPYTIIDKALYHRLRELHYHKVDDVLQSKIDKTIYHRTAGIKTIIYVRWSMKIDVFQRKIDKAFYRRTAGW